MQDKVFLMSGSAAGATWVGDATEVVQLISAAIFLVVVSIKLFKELRDDA